MRLEEIYDECLKAVENCKRIYIYGAGSYAARLSDFLEYHGKTVSGYIETQKDKSRNCDALYSYEEFLKIVRDEDCIVLGVSIMYREQIISQMNSIPVGIKYIPESWKMYEIFKFRAYLPNYAEYKDKEISVERWNEYLNVYTKVSDYRKPYQEKYKFSNWHIGIGDYTLDTLEYIRNAGENINRRPTLVDVGCGLGNIVGNPAFDGWRRIGLDLHELIIKCDKEVFYTDDDIEFSVGTFDNVSDMSIDFLIALGFMHNINEQETEKEIRGIFERNYIDYFIVDWVTAPREGRYAHDFKKILPDNYDMIEEMGPYASPEGGRWIGVFKRI